MRPEHDLRNQWFAEAYTDGASMRDIADTAGVKHQRIHQVLEALGIPRRSRGSNAHISAEVRQKAISVLRLKLLNAGLI